MSTTTAPHPNCHACAGTGTDVAFGGSCSECARYGTTRIADRAEHVAPRPLPTGGTGTGTGSSSRPATAKQLAFITRLCDERDPDARAVVKARRYLEAGLFTTTIASKAIDALIDLPKVSAPTVADAPAPTGLDLAGLPAGLYAVPGGDSRLKVQVQAPTTGKWAGWVFVKDGAVYGGGARYGSQRPGGTYRGQIVEQLTTIAADPLAAMAEYGKLTGTCGRCSRPLEDETSVERGIGPICWSKLTG